MDENICKKEENLSHSGDNMKYHDTIKEKINHHKENEKNDFKNYCPFIIPENRNISAIDDILNSKENIIEFKNLIFRNLEIDKLDYDMCKIEYKKSLLNNEEYKNKKWYLNFQPLNNISIEQYWKYEKVTLKDIFSSNINLTNNIELKKNKKYLKHIAKCILKGKPHESLIKNYYKFSANYLNNSDKHSKNSFNNINSSFLSLNSRTIKNSQNLLNWKLKYSKNLSNFQNVKSKENENSSSINSINLENKKSNFHFNQGNSDILSNNYKKDLKDYKKKSKKKNL
ncbi:conserved Plasmodium protein, unknown function [Plasmodium gallinaceum]|uniref:Uncharacterized protein n=1 Tax=Plasmodium gallinaceum TaxID=5849 RepID=A0A1J1GLF4_PLAGA|nr:conserved Plasmodium protein, unknown function [Plasmodium gallinaceum]CRG93037.1 conserved Plasmodium protein, unknown function [Plasmodium gallinaceum]